MFTISFVNSLEQDSLFVKSTKAGIDRGRSLGMLGLVAGLCGLILVPVAHLGSRLSSRRAVAVCSRLGTIQIVRLDHYRADQIGAGIWMAARAWRVADRSCVARSLVAYVMCRWCGIPGVINVGMAADSRESHCWVSVCDHAIDDTLDVASRYVPFDGSLLPRA